MLVPWEEVENDLHLDDGVGGAGLNQSQVCHGDDKGVKRRLLLKKIVIFYCYVGGISKRGKNQVAVKGGKV